MSTKAKFELPGPHPSARALGSSRNLSNLRWRITAGAFFLGTVTWQFLSGTNLPLWQTRQISHETAPRPAVPTPTRALDWSDVNFIHTTDTHGESGVNLLPPNISILKKIRLAIGAPKEFRARAECKVELTADCQ